MAPSATSASALREHLEFPRGLGALERSPHTGAAGGAACGDLIRVSVQVDGDRVVAAGFRADGCAAARAAGSAAVELVEGRGVLAAAAVTPQAVAAELGGLSPAASHAAELAADALHRALGMAARDGAVTLAPVAGRTLVAMSGGVDSAAAAQLALEAGEDVVAVTLELWSDPGTDGDKSCCSPQAVTGARALAHRMGIPHFTLDLRERFRADVVDDFLAGYAGGSTPNPCVRCNGLVRFDAMLDLAGRVGAGALATGHYARIAEDGDGPLVRAGAEAAKDQSYVLARLTGDELARLRFPLGDMAKPRVRELAEAAGLPVARKPESQDLCFLAGSSGPDFMRRHGTTPQRAGSIVDRSGNVLGRHDGHQRFTVGQRRGIGVAAREPLYVLDKDARSNRVVVGTRAELGVRSVAVDPLVLHRPAARGTSVRLRYHGPALACGVRGQGRIALEREVARPAPGQTACLMDGDLVVGWGTMRATTDV
ncbi:MAG TPA: tRNA 2-thiouridine(34) synthase MnmA [Thermoleophilaceae bacterium]|nr:tRNA 2-thiouridine(34) synthase MnmA [Thermoleophilaceae bacterium]